MKSLKAIPAKIGNDWDKFAQQCSASYRCSRSYIRAMRLMHHISVFEFFLGTTKIGQCAIARHLLCRNRERMFIDQIQLLPSYQSYWSDAMRSVLTLMGEGTYCYGSWWSTEPSRENDFHEIDEITILRTKSYNLHAVDFSAWNDWQQYYRAVSTNAKRNAAKAAKSDPAIRITHNGLTFHDALEMIRMRRKMFKRKGLLSSGLFSSALQFLFRMVLMSDHVFVTRIYYHEKLSAFMSGVRFGEHIYYIDGASLEDNGGSAWYLMLKNIKMFYDAHRGGKFIMGSDPPGTATIWDGWENLLRQRQQCRVADFPTAIVTFQYK